MTENRTQSMLQRLPAILAVTAHSFGLAPGAARTRRGHLARPGRAAATRTAPARDRIGSPR